MTSSFSISPTSLPSLSLILCPCHERPALTYPVSRRIDFPLMPRLTFEFIVEGVLLFIVGCVGVCANVIAMLVFLKKRNVCFYR